MSVRDLERLVAAELERAEPGRVTVGASNGGKQPYIVDLEERLCQAVGTRVTIAAGRARNTGRIVIDYYNLDDFDRITEALGLKGE